MTGNIDHELLSQLENLIAPTNEFSQPNLTALALKLKNLDIISLNLKFFGFELARRLASSLPSCVGSPFKAVGLTSKACIQADIESDWAAHWFGQLQIPRLYHRKLWELAFCLQCLAEHDMLQPGRRGLGFGCGEEPIASYLAAHGVETTITDLPPEDAAASGWRDTYQHLSQASTAFRPHLVDREKFDQNVSIRFVDMNAIPADLLGYDFCWSICALEHLGTIAKGMTFVENSLATLKPGGVAVHTTEFNFLSQDATLDNWPTVLPQRRHFEELAERLRNKGHFVAPLDFDVGVRPLDRFIDIPPYPGDPGGRLELLNGHHECAHLKLSIDGFASTCFGLVIKKAVEGS
ncbi:MAG: methyltransferase type 11 [Rhodoblastus sp.]|nr:methyltransferase type 11 [Rhodoblastus sp.]